LPLAGDKNTCSFLPQKQTKRQESNTTIKKVKLHADGTNQLTKYDFLLVFCNDLRSRWNHCVGYKPSKSADRNHHQKEQKNNNIKYPSNEPLLLEERWLKQTCGGRHLGENISGGIMETM